MRATDAGPGPNEQRTTARLILRRPDRDDAAFLLALHSTPEGIAHNPSDALADVEAARARLTAWDRHWRAGLGYWIVQRSSDRRPIGVCGARAVELHDLPSWNLLYRFLPETWGRGYAREAARAAIDAADALDGRRPVVARIRPANTASARVAIALGLHRRPDLDLMGDDGPDEVWSTTAS